MYNKFQEKRVVMRIIEDDKGRRKVVVNKPSPCNSKEELGKSYNQYCKNVIGADNLEEHFLKNLVENKVIEQTQIPKKRMDIHHFGDCSIYMANSDICDCGAYRKAIINADIDDEELWEAWAKHCAALDEAARVMHKKETNVMKELLFENPVFNKGTNVTVRRGIKWSMESKAIVKDLGEVDLKPVVMRFEDIEVDDIRYEHDPECRTQDGLKKVMQEVYPGFSSKEIVTLVYFDVE